MEVVACVDGNTVGLLGFLLFCAFVVWAVVVRGD